MRVKLPDFKNREEAHRYLKANKAKLIAEKCAEKIYTSDTHIKTPADFCASQLKTLSEVEGDPSELRVRTVANSANWMDSHRDVLISGAPAESMERRKGIIPHLHDHVHKVSAKVGEVADITLEQISLRELGVNREGSTEAVVFTTDLQKAYNPMVFNQYRLGKINQHSIGLQYRRLELAYNDEDDKEEYGIWLKYIDQIINREEAERYGYFWAVEEYELIENSAVLFGSNSLTPTLDNNVTKYSPGSTDKRRKGLNLLI